MPPYSGIKDYLFKQLDGETEPSIIAKYLYSQIVEQTNKFAPTRQTSWYSAKTLDDVIEMIEKAIRHYEGREHVTADARVNFSFEDPNKPEELELITVSPTQIKPGAFERTSPSTSSALVRNLVPTLREELLDPDNQGYHLLILGYSYDNWITLTCWARTTKAAHKRATWLENLIEEYSWFFTAGGINRIIYQGRQKKIIREVSNNMFVGYPVEYYVRTERLIRASEKTLEQLVIEFDVATS